MSRINLQIKIILMPPVKPEDFTTKSKHLMDRGRDFESVYTQNPQAYLPGLLREFRWNIIDSEHGQLDIFRQGCPRTCEKVER